MNNSHFEDDRKYGKQNDYYFTPENAERKPKRSKHRHHHPRSRSRSNSFTKFPRKYNKSPSYQYMPSSRSPERYDAPYRRDSRSPEYRRYEKPSYQYNRNSRSPEPVRYRDSSYNYIPKSRSPEPRFHNAPAYEQSSSKSIKKSSRWGSSQNFVPQHLRYEDALVYSLKMQLNELTNKLAQKNYASEYELMARLPEPDPVYGADGKRINTKEQRARERLENRKKEITIQLHDIRPDLVTNADKIMATRVSEKVFIPQDDHPDINFAGLIIGPRGMTQKELEKETDTKIILRGKGSVKVAKIAGTGQSLPGEDEPLHAYITASSRENVLLAAEKIQKIVDDAIEHPELENELRKNQMKQLAIINGTYRETDGLNKLKMKEEMNSIVTNTIICSMCGGTGHLPRDCKIGNMPLEPSSADLKDPEYKEFLKSIGKSLESYVVEQPVQEPKGVSNFIKNFVFKT